MLEVFHGLADDAARRLAGAHHEQAFDDAAGELDHFGASTGGVSMMMTRSL